MKNVKLEIGLNLKIYDRIERFCKRNEIDEDTKSAVMFLTNEIYRNQSDNPRGKFLVSLKNLTNVFGSENLLKIYLCAIQTSLDSMEVFSKNDVVFILNIKSDCFYSDSYIFKINISESVLQNYMPSLVRMFEPTF